MADPVVRLSINLPPDVAALLQDYATRHDLSKTEVVALAVREVGTRRNSRRLRGVGSDREPSEDREAVTRTVSDREDLAGTARSVFLSKRPLFGDTGANPVGWEFLAAAILAAGWAQTSSDDD